MSRTPWIPLVLALAAAPAPAQVFTKIADTSTPVPGGGGTFQSFDGFPALRDDAVVLGATDGLGVAGVWKSVGGTLVKIADENTALPDGLPGETIDSIPTSTGSSPTIDEHGNVAFVATGSQGTTGVYAHIAALTRIHDDDEAANWDGFFAPTIDDGQVGFVARRDSIPPASHVLAGTAPTILTGFASTSTSIPSGSGTFTNFGVAVLDSDEMAFVGFGPSAQQGVYKYGVGGTRIADKTMNAPGSGGLSFQSFANVTIRDGNVGFIATSGTFPLHSGIYSHRNGALDVVVDKTTPVTDGVGDYLGFGGPSLDGDTIAFMGIDGAGDRGLYTDACGTLVEIIDTGDLLDGKAISFLAIGPNALDGGKLAFWVTFADNTTAVYVASLEGAYGAYGLGLAGSGGAVPHLGGSPAPIVGEATSIDVTGGLGGANGVLFLGVDFLDVPFKGGSLLVDPLIAVPQTLSGSPGLAGDGTGSVPFVVPADLSGITLYLQGGYWDTGAVSGVSLTNGLAVCVP